MFPIRFPPFRRNLFKPKDHVSYREPYPMPVILPKKEKKMLISPERRYSIRTFFSNLFGALKILFILFFGFALLMTPIVYFIDKAQKAYIVEITASTSQWARSHNGRVLRCFYAAENRWICHTRTPTGLYTHEYTGNSNIPITITRNEE